MEVYKCSLPPAVKQHAAEYLHEKEEERDSDISQILDWLQGQSHLHARCGVYHTYCELYGVEKQFPDCVT
jgi:hypothetical protein